METPPSTGGWMPSLVEFAGATGAALLASYVKAKQNPKPWSAASIIARVAESVVCGCLAILAAALLKTGDPRFTIGMSAAIGLLGTQAITDLLLRVLTRRADKV